jgi:hypothetical protein
MALSLVGPPRADGPVIPFVRRLKAASTLQCQIGAKEPFWLFVHWTGHSGTLVCRAVRNFDGEVIDDTECKHCKAFRPERRKAFLWIFNYATRKKEFLEITENCWDCIVTQGGKCPDLRGWELKLTRGKGERARFFVALEPPRPTCDLSRITYPPLPDAAVLKVMGG